MHSLFEKESKYYKQTVAFDGNSTPHLKTVSIKNSNSENTNIDQLIEGVKNALKDESNKESMDKIEHLATAIMGPYGVTGFKVAWVMKAIIAKYEKDNDNKLTINVESTELTKDDLKNYTVEYLENIVKAIREDESEIVGKLVDPTNDLGK